MAEPDARPASALPRTESVCGVLVTYRPDPDQLRACVTAAHAQLDELVVVDNASPGIERLLAGLSLPVLASATNRGLAAAQNEGIAYARRNGHTHVLLLDQDSVAAPAMVAELLAATRRLSGAGRVGAVGPRFRDARDGGDAPFVRVAFPLSHKLRCTGGCREIEADFLISSGTLIALDVLDAVGPMTEDLFIDNVDLEWSFRARARGYRLYGVCGAVLAHRLGDSRREFLGGRWQRVVHSPVRLYFIMRNRLRLYRMPHVPRVWVAQDAPRIVMKMLIFGVFVAPRGRNLKYMLAGLRDGLAGRGGPCPLESR
jgi:rhamnosyltransferase